MALRWNAPQQSSDGSGWTFDSYLDAHPETREVLLERMKSIPEYEAWLRLFGDGVLSALEATES